MMKKILNKNAKRLLPKWDLKGFEKRFPKFLEAILASMQEVEDKYTRSVSTVEVDLIYNLYPTKCLVNQSPTGKSNKDKVTIKRRLKKDYTVGELNSIIHRYIKDCVKHKIYMKNFSTFLNNIPDYAPEKPKTVTIPYLSDEEERTLDNNEKDRLIYKRKMNGNNNK